MTVQVTTYTPNSTNPEYENDLHRSVVVLSDGTVCVGIFDVVNSTFKFYHSANRTSFSLVVSLASVVTAFSMAIDASDNIWVLYQLDFNSLTLRKLAKGAGYTWTAGSAETVRAVDATRTIHTADLDVLVGGMVGIIWSEYFSSTHTLTVLSRGRTSGGTYGTNVQIYTTTGTTSWSNFSYGATFMSRDLTAAAANTEYCYCGAYLQTGVGVKSARIGYDETTGNANSTDLTPPTVFPEVSGDPKFVRMTSFPQANGQWYVVAFYAPFAQVTFGWQGGFFGNPISGFSKINVKVYSVQWTPAEAAFTLGTTVMSHFSSSRVRPAVAYLSGNTKLAFFSRATNPDSYGPLVGAMTFDVASNTFSTYFSYSVSGSGTSARSLHSGAQRNNSQNKADITYGDYINGVEFFESLLVPTAPSGVLTPANGASITSGLPLLEVVLPIPAAPIPAYAVKARWQIADDSGFTTNVKTISEPDGDLSTTSGTHSEYVNNPNYLHQGTKFIKAATLDAFGQVSSYSASSSFAISNPPIATPVAPMGNVGLDFGGTGNTSIVWVFSDPSPTDTQTAYQIIVERLSDLVTVLDTGKVTSSAQSVVVTISSTYKDTTLQWRVRVWDSDDVVGNYTENNFFRVEDPGVVAITAPTDGGTVTTPTPTVNWTFTAAGGRTENRWRLIVQDTTPGHGGVTVFDTGWRFPTSLTFTIPSLILANASNYRILVSGQDEDGLVGTSSIQVTTAWTPPAAPTFVVDNSTYSGSGYIKVTWTNASKDASWISWNLYRQKFDVDSIGNPINLGAWELADIETVDQSSYEYHDYFIGSNNHYNYVVRQAADRFGTMVESVDALPLTTVIALSENYWLLHPFDSSQHLMLSQVTADSFSDEYEEEVMLLIGRGRKTDYGTHWGYIGSLTCEVWDQPTRTARQQRMLLEALKADRQEMWLRNPFGDLFSVTMGNAQIDRVAGVGTREFHVLTLPYRQVN